MTRLWVLSDLHQEFTRDPTYGTHPLTKFDPAAQPPTSFDVVVLAGDIEVPLTRSLDWAAERFPGVPVIYVPGNHDFYNDAGDRDQFTIAEMMDAGRDHAARLGIHLLMDDTAVIGGTRFVGATLWTDFATVGQGSWKARQAQAVGRDGMNDYRRIKRESTAHPGRRKRLRPMDTIARHRRSRAFIEETLQSEHQGSTVVVTHHAPLPQSLGEGEKKLAFCYASNLSLLFEEVPQPAAWIHGHIHHAVDYRHGETRIISNPRGYMFEPDHADNGFRPDLIVEIP